MNKTVKLSQISDLMTEILENGGRVTFTTKGRSMMPLLDDGKDKVVLSKPESPLKKKDVIFYQRDDGQYVLHRIIKIYNNQYITRGDNQWELEYGIMDKNIIAVAVAFERKGKLIKCTDWRYKTYCNLLPFTRTFNKIYSFVIKILKKINQKRKSVFNKKVK